MNTLFTNKKIVIAITFIVLFSTSIIFRNSVSRLLYFGLDEEVYSLKESVPLSSTPVPPLKSGVIEVDESGREEFAKPVLPSYTGRDPGEIRPVPEEVKIFSEEQKSKLFSLITMHAKTVKESLNSFDSWMQIGILKKTIGDFEGARDAWEYVGVIAPLNSVSFSNLGELYWRYLHYYSKSESNFKTSIKNKPDDSSTYISLSGLYFYSYEEKQDLADDILFEGLKANPDNANLMRALASLYEKQKDYIKSLEWWKKVLAKEPNNKEVAQTIDDLKKKISQPATPQ